MIPSTIAFHSSEPNNLTLSTPDFEFVRALVQKRSAIAIDSDKHYLAETRLLTLARREGYPSIDDLVDDLRHSDSEALGRKVIEAMTTHETSFFRDVQPFEVLRTTILPEIIRERQAERRLQIWCGACSTGQEPYSVAMLLREHFPLLQSWDVRILASDISTEVLDRAREGRFTQHEVNRGLPVRMLVKYFTKKGSDWFIKNEPHRLVDFHEINLSADWPLLPEFDLILLRNVLIYFEVATKRQILTRLRRHLKPWGTLILGGAETTLNIDEGYERVPMERMTCYRPLKR